jgi:hypothetical protein
MVRKKRRRSQSRLGSAIAGGILLGIALLWLGRILFFQHGHLSGITLPGLAPSLQHGRLSGITLPGLAPSPTNPPEIQIPQLVAEGITLEQANQTPKLSQQQALFIASQRQPDAASAAKVATARYVLLNAPVTGTPTTHPSLTNIPVWMVWYQHIPQNHADPAIDPTPLAHPFHDLYVFLDANSGKEVLSVWV